jgi:hypothetical protein
LTGFETIDDRWDGTDVVCHTVQDEFLIDKVGNRDFVNGMIEIKTGLQSERMMRGDLRDMSGAILYGRRLSSWRRRVRSIPCRRAEKHESASNVYPNPKSRFWHRRSYSSQDPINQHDRQRQTDFVVFHFPLFVVGRVFLPVLVFRHGKEGNIILACLGNFDDRGDEFDEEAGDGEETGVKGFKVIDDETLDMTSVVILIRHDHQVAVSQGLCVFVLFAVLETHDLTDGVDFGVLHDHLMRRISDVEKFTAQWED